MHFQKAKRVYFTNFGFRTFLDIDLKLPDRLFHKFLNDLKYSFLSQFYFRLYSKHFGLFFYTGSGIPVSVCMFIKNRNVEPFYLMGGMISLNFSMVCKFKKNRCQAIVSNFNKYLNDICQVFDFGGFLTLSTQLICRFFEQKFLNVIYFSAILLN